MADLRAVAKGHQFLDEAALLRHASTLKGKTAAQVAQASSFDRFLASGTATGRTGVGHVVERYFGIYGDNEQRPDFANLGVELKTIPLKRLKQGWSVKEATSISMIDYHHIITEDWGTTPLRSKIQRILWIPYAHDFNDRRQAAFRRPFLWSPDREDLPILRRDFETVRTKVIDGRAHELSESQCQVMGARRKGAAGSMRTQPRSPIPAKSRAWAFKARYTRPIVDRHVFGREMTRLVGQIEGLDDLGKVESIVTSRLGVHAGLTLDEVAHATGGEIHGGKAGPAGFVRALLGVQGKGRIEEFEKLGISVKTVWAHPESKQPWEAMSFPAMSLRDLAMEEWESSELAGHVSRILIIPLFSETRSVRGGKRRLGQPFFWEPTGSQLSAIGAEWRRYRDLVRQGAAAYRPILDEDGKPVMKWSGKRHLPVRENDLPNMSDTDFIHMRPHGSDVDDTDIDPLGAKVTKQCFWLNKAFIQRILDQNLP